MEIPLPEEVMLHDLQDQVTSSSFVEQATKYLERRKTTCAACKKPDHEKLKRCTACSFFYYCTVDCQRSHWNSEHKSECKKFKKQVELFPSRDVVPLWYIHYSLNWIKIDEFLFHAKKNQEKILSNIKNSFKDVSPVTDLMVSWIPSKISIDGNTKHLVVYLSYPFWNEEEQQENYSEQFFYEIFLVGPEKSKHSNIFGNKVIDSVKEFLKVHQIDVRNVTYGCGFKNSD